MSTSTKPLLGRSGMSAATWVMLAVTVVSVVLAVALPLRQLGESGAAVPVTLTEAAADQAGQALELGDLPDGASVTSATDEFELAADDLPAGLRLLSQAPASLVLLSVAGGGFCLTRLLRSIRAGRPFDRRNPGRLTGVAVAILAGGLLAPILGNVATTAVLGHLQLIGPDSPFVLVIVDLRFNALLYAAVVLAVAEAFRRGGRLADDVEGLV